ncbi:MAG: phosphate ABC transporter permease PstA [Candidatus Omnitrophica bacterium]|nr:phosphate ABC transporter permease PstA [Candidatus Omnitrophota bacterium]
MAETQENAEQKIFVQNRRGVAGEAWVWFTAMGLTIGVAMVIGLLSLIGFRGLKVFWPQRAVVLQLQSESGSTQTMAGVITKEQEKAGHYEEGSEKQIEWQIFQGNKEVLGLSYKFVDYTDIQKVEYPLNLIRVERLEYGDAFGFPVSLKTPDGGMIDAGDPAFSGELAKAVKQATRVRKEIKTIEKKQIGKINYAIEDKKIKLKGLERKQKAGTAEAEKINAELKDLFARYEILAAKARQLRDQSAGYVLVYKISSGQEKNLPAEKMVDFYFPNQLNRIERFQRFCHRIFHFLADEPREANTEGGVFPAIFGTFVMTVMMSLFVTPFGVMAAIYLREYAKQGVLVQIVRIAVNNLAGVPSIVFGVFGVGFFVYFVGGSIDQLFFADRLPTPTYGTGGILWASLTLALLTVPVVIVASEESLASVPNGMREGSLACGASKWQTIQRVVLPAAAPGILTGFILAMARGASEVAPLMLVGVVKLAPNLPIDNIFPFMHFDRKFMHLGFHIYDLGFQSPDSEAAKPMVFATTLLLISLVVLLNLSAIWIRERLRKKYVVGTF